MGKKDDKKKTAEELNVLFKPVEQKVTKGTYVDFIIDIISFVELPDDLCDILV